MESFYIIIVITIVLIILFKRYSPGMKGSRGENRVAQKLKRLNKEEYIVLNDILIKTDKGTSQIDHVIVSIYGIFVLETKNYKGWIHGGEKSEYWTQTIYNEKHKFRNPIKQNWAHLHALNDVLIDFGKIQYYPIVVFAGEATLKNVYTELPVIYDDELINVIKENSQIQLMPMYRVYAIAAKLKNINIEDKKERKEHIYKIKESVYKRKENEIKMICPKCGGSLALREGKYGKFYGCSNYPKCKFTKGP